MSKRRTQQTVDASTMTREHLMRWPFRHARPYEMQQLQHHRLRSWHNDNAAVFAANHQSTLLRQVYTGGQFNRLFTIDVQLIEYAGRRRFHQCPGITQTRANGRIQSCKKKYIRFVKLQLQFQLIYNADSTFDSIRILNLLHFFNGNIGHIPQCDVTLGIATQQKSL